MEENTKIRKIRDVTFEGPNRGAGKGRRWSVNEDINSENITGRQTRWGPRHEGSERVLGLSFRR